MIKPILITVLLVFLSIPMSTGAPNPAAVYCNELGYSTANGDCVFPDGTRCPTWHFYRGKCGQQWSLCVQQGGRFENRVEDRGSWTAEYGVCVFEVVSECGEQELMDGSCTPGDCAKWSSAKGCEPLGAPSDSAAASPTHCRAEELKVFNCVMEGPEELVLSVCASDPLGDRGGYLQYRFGPQDRVEMEYPERKAGSYEAFEYTRYTRPRTTYLRVGFKVGNHKYSVSQDSAQEGSSAGVRVIMPDGGKTRFRCRDAGEGSLMKLENHVPNKDWTEVEM
jgi:putative hemolysin